MKRKKAIMIAMALGMVCGSVAMLCPTPSVGIAYRVLGGKNEMTILGSIHIGNRAMYPFCKALQEKIAQADVLVFECDTQSDKAKALTATAMHYPDGERIDAYLSESTYLLLEQTAQKIGYNFEQWKTMRPWALTSLLSTHALTADMRTNNTNRALSLGVEQEVRRLGMGKKEYYLETTQYQLDTLAGLNPALQEYLLSSACRTILSNESVQNDTAKWPTWWKNGDAQAFAQSYLAGLAMEAEPLQAQEYHQTLITRRNQSMAQSLRAWLESTEQHCYFVTMGLMHLVLEDDSVLCELEKFGYKVERIESE